MGLSATELVMFSATASKLGFVKHEADSLLEILAKIDESKLAALRVAKHGEKEGDKKIPARLKSILASGGSVSSTKGAKPDPSLIAAALGIYMLSKQRPKRSPDGKPLTKGGKSSPKGSKLTGDDLLEAMMLKKANEAHGGISKGKSKIPENSRLKGPVVSSTKVKLAEAFSAPGS